MVTIKSLKSLGKAPVCDISIMEYPCYYVNGIATHNSGEPKWISAFQRGEDLHRQTAEAVWGKENYNKDKRKKAKFVNFGKLYGASPWTLAEQMESTLEEAKEFDSKWNYEYRVMAAWIHAVCQNARRTGVVYSAIGRPRRLLEYFQSGDKKQIGFAYRSAVNTQVQGVAADILRIDLIKLFSYLRKLNSGLKVPRAKWISSVHDEANLLISQEHAAEIIPETVNVMTFRHPKWPLPLTVDFELGYSWGQTWGYKIDSVGDIVPAVEAV